MCLHLCRDHPECRFWEWSDMGGDMYTCKFFSEPANAIWARDSKDRKNRIGLADCPGSVF